ncbi:hypothetical protein Tco_0456216 [Tanacetum coccineum]
METLTRLYIKEIVSPDRSAKYLSTRILDKSFHTRFWQSLQSALGTQLDVKVSSDSENGESLIPGTLDLSKSLNELAQWYINLSFLKNSEMSTIPSTFLIIGSTDLMITKLHMSLNNDLRGLNRLHTNLKKCLSDESLVIPMKELWLDDKLNVVEEPVEIMDQEVKQLRQIHIPIVKVRWNSKRGPEFTWEREDQIRAKYPRLFSNITPASN